ncbi:hypothetical protein BDV10DRAFT_140089 [Aspergillus recurvatus]
MSIYLYLRASVPAVFLPSMMTAILGLIIHYLLSFSSCPIPLRFLYISFYFFYLPCLLFSGKGHQNEYILEMYNLSVFSYFSAVFSSKILASLLVVGLLFWCPSTSRLFVISLFVSTG